MYNNLKVGVTEKSGGETKILKWGEGNKLDQGVSALKRGAGTTLRTMPSIFKVLKNLLDSLQLHFRYKF